MNRWHREGHLLAGLVFTWGWRYSNGEQANIVVECHAAAVVLRYSFRGDGEWESVNETVALERTPCRFGGFRSWFRCPGCRRRVVKLYGPGKRFRCRRCYGLAYTSQREKADARARRKAIKIRRRLGGGANFVERFPSKPPGMHWLTYARLFEAAQAAELASLRAAGAAIDRMFSSRLFHRRLMGC